jgi:hypothetical protein
MIFSAPPLEKRAFELVQIIMIDRTTRRELGLRFVSGDVLDQKERGPDTPTYASVLMALSGAIGLETVLIESDAISL